MSPPPPQAGAGQPVELLERLAVVVDGRRLRGRRLQRGILEGAGTDEVEEVTTRLPQSLAQGRPSRLGSFLSRNYRLACEHCSIGVNLTSGPWPSPEPSTLIDLVPSCTSSRYPGPRDHTSG